MGYPAGLVSQRNLQHSQDLAAAGDGAAAASATAAAVSASDAAISAASARFPVVAPAVLGTDFALDADSSYHTVCSLVLGVGTWDLATIATILAGGTSEVIYLRLFDGTTAITTGQHDNGADFGIANTELTVTLPGRIVIASGTKTVSLQARTTDNTAGDQVLSALDGQAAGSATHLIATQIA